MAGTPSAEAQPAVYVLAQVSTTDGVQQYLTVIDGATNRKVARIQLGKSVGLESAHLLAIAPDGERIYVLNDRDNTVSVIATATNTVIDTLPRSMFVPPGVSGSPPIYALAVSPDGRRLYVSGLGLAVIDTASRRG
jgi:YVTN family beta-propeller protein